MDPWEAGLQVWALRMRGAGLSLGCFMPLSKLGKGTLSITTFIVIYWKMITTHVPSYNGLCCESILWVYVMYSLCTGVQWPPLSLFWSSRASYYSTWLQERRGLCTKG